ncbi:hypothetical protein ACPA54_37675 [Uniformispora flossi]|uniref:hypothetical protein n=1 Tax=Uniformispora flossi TaxID=3390723 RepID=UPI003C2D2D94
MVRRRSLAALAAGAPDTEFYAVNADFEPDGPLLAKLRAADLLMDAVFPEANDLVVPTEGVVDMTPGSAAGFPIPADRFVHFPAPRAVWHCTLFGEPETRAKLVEWLRP